MAKEASRAEALRRARRNERFWRMVFAQGGVNFAELKAMDLEAFMEAEQARLLWQDKWNKK